MAVDSKTSEEAGHKSPHESHQALRRAVEASIGSFFTEGNEVTVLKNGVEIFPAMLEAIRGAEKSIEFLTFIYWTGGIARAFADALSERARAGIRVRVLLDAYGTRPMRKELVDQMEDAGVAVERFRPILRWKLWESDHRTHRKIMIVDNRIGFTGGVGIAEEWEGDARGPDEWRDTHFRVVGPAVTALRSVFFTDWRDTGNPITSRDVAVELPEALGSSPVAVVDGSAQIGYDDAELVLEALFAVASERIRIQTPYLNPTWELVELLEQAAGRGVEIDLLIPGPHLDKRISRVMAREISERLIAAGARVWAYQPTMMHVKAVLVDGVLALVGSINVNRRSTEKDEEVALAICDPEVTSLLERHFEGDMQLSEPVDIEPTSLMRRLKTALVRPLIHEM
jgi:cardiolipin synthase